MADMAVVFHWPLSEMDRLGLDELGRFWAKARARSGKDQDT